MAFTSRLSIALEMAFEMMWMFSPTIIIAHHSEQISDHPMRQ
jgi:hypothetical protein